MPASRMRISMGVRKSEPKPRGGKEPQSQIDRSSLRPWRTLRLGVKPPLSPAHAEKHKTVGTNSEKSLKTKEVRFYQVRKRTQNEPGLDIRPTLFTQSSVFRDCYPSLTSRGEPGISPRGCRGSKKHKTVGTNSGKSLKTKEVGFYQVRKRTQNEPSFGRQMRRLESKTGSFTSSEWRVSASRRRLTT